MKKRNKKNIRIFVIVGVMLLVAYLCRLFGNSGILPRQTELLRSFIYISLFIAWGISLYSRIVHPQVRNYMAVAVGLFIFWIILGTVKTLFTDSLPVLSRYMCYLYYLPKLFIPLFVLFSTFCIGSPGNKPLPKKTVFLFILPSILFLAVMTNDLHHLIFTPPSDATTLTVSNYRYAFGYAVIFVYLMLCTAAVLWMLFRKCRLPGKWRSIVLSCLPVAVLLVYRTVGYLQIDWLYYLAEDTAMVFCLMYAATLEVFIRRGLIQNNTGYIELFMAGRLGGQITDQENVVRLASSNARELTEKQRMNARIHPLVAEKDILFKSKPIRFGHVLWQEDVSELNEAIERIEENCRNLAERNQIQRKNLETRKQILALQEKNRVSDLIHREIASQITLIDRMLAKYDTETDEGQRRRLLAGAAVVGSYIKRYGNLLLVSQRVERADIRDLTRCFEESFVNLELLEVDCLCTLPSNMMLDAKYMLHIYHTFEEVLEDCLFDLHQVWVNARERKGQILLSIDFVCKTDLSAHGTKADLFSCDDGTSRFTFKMQKGGEVA